MTLMDEPSQDPRDVWNGRYQRHPNPDAPDETWLEPWLGWIERLVGKSDAGSQQSAGVHLSVSSGLILDLGCGRGQDSGYLAELGFHPVGADFSLTALQRAGEQCALARRVNLDLRQGLPFSPGAFGVVIANLSLHYFEWPRTEGIVQEVRGCLAADGLFLARFNSTQDTNYGASSDVEIEPHAFMVGGIYKRFFDRPDLERLFAEGWKIHSLEERTIYRYQDPKVLWEVVASKQDCQGAEALPQAIFL